MNSTNKQDLTLCSTPNQYAREASIELYEHSVVFHGYQEFILTKNTNRIISIDDNLQTKYNILIPFFQPRYLARRSLLDLGANAGFFCFWALQQGAAQATAIDSDQTYINMAEEAAKHLQFDTFRAILGNAAEWDQPSDCVLALALIHWIYSCTAVLGSLNNVIKKLSEITNYMLIVEWIAPEDPAINFFRHLDWNKDQTDQSYTFSAFEDALKKYFSHYSQIGEVSPTRKIFAAFKQPLEIDLSNPLVSISNKNIIHSHLLTVYNKIHYWSAIYTDDSGNLISKITTLDIAEREFYFLKLLDKPYFPKAFDLEVNQSYSIITMERIIGITLKEFTTTLQNNKPLFISFIKDCLNILAIMKEKNISHRDIREDNIIIRDNKPVLIDFGWAISDKKPLFIPENLGGEGRLPDGDICDIYSMGIILRNINNDVYPDISSVITLMVQTDSQLRVTDIDILHHIFHFIASA